MASLSVVNENMTYVEALRAIEFSYGAKLVVEPGGYWPGGDSRSYPVWWVRFVHEEHRLEWNGMEDARFVRLSEDILPYDQQINEALQFWEEELDVWMRIAP